MSKAKKKEKVFTPGAAPPQKELEELPSSRYADEEGVETTNILQPKSKGGGSASGTDSSGTADYIFKGVTPGKAFLHPPKRLTEGRVVYRAKFYGHMNVKAPKGPALVKDTIDMLKTVAEVYRANNPGKDKVKIVDLSISVRGITCVEEIDGKKEVVIQHPIHAISFSAEDKRGKAGNMLAFIARGRPPRNENICYVLEVKPKQAKEVIATIGQAFELAYRKYLDAKKAREGFEQLKQIYHTASEEDKKKIKVQLEEESKRRAKERAAELEKQKKQIKVDPSYRPSHSGAAPATVAEGSSMTVTADDPELMAAIQQQAKQMELDSKIQAQSKGKPPEDGQRPEESIATKWENITIAIEPFQVEPSLDPNTQYLVPRLETSELDDAISDITSQIEDLEAAFSWRTKAEEEKKVDMTPFDHPLFASVDEKLKAIEATADELEVPDLPINYVMDEYVKAREQANLPKKGTVKEAASEWYKSHHD